MINVAIVGSGPSGCYIADMLSKKLANAQIDIYDRLPTPFGLVRSGVAPDHQGTKNIVRQFDRIFQRVNVRFIGNINIGSDISYQELKENYEIVVITIGAVKDRKLEIPGEELNGVYGSGQFASWYNGHPDQADLSPNLNGNAIAIIGNGNVALDISRVLSKTGEEMRSSDITAEAKSKIEAALISDIYLIGRRGPLEASFTNMELCEFSELQQCVALADPGQLPVSLPEDTDPKIATELQNNLVKLNEFAANDPDSKPIRLHLMFNHSPLQVNGRDGSVRSITLEKNSSVNGSPVPTGETVELQVQTLISAIGYRSNTIEGMPFDDIRGTVSHNDSVIESGVYTAGWCKRGPQGVIPSNRSDAMSVAKKIIADLEASPPESNKPGAVVIDDLMKRRNLTPVSFEQWQIINHAEINRAPEGKPREKFNRVPDMLALL